jgi:hypothetical protein
MQVEEMVEAIPVPVVVMAEATVVVAVINIQEA